MRRESQVFGFNPAGRFKRIERMATRNEICKRFKNSHCFAVKCRFDHPVIVEGRDAELMLFQVHAGRSVLHRYGRDAADDWSINCHAHPLTPLPALVKFIRIHFVIILLILQQFISPNLLFFRY